MAKSLPVIRSSSLLLCEGEDEVNFFNAWLPELGLLHVQLLAYNGKAKLAEYLSDLSKRQGFEEVDRVAITRDADEDWEAATRSIQHIITHSPLSIQQLSPTFFVLPGEGRQGALEALWLASLAEHPYTDCVEGFFSCLQAQGWQPSQTFAKNDKARAQLWIATKDTPNEAFGRAAWHGRRDTDKPWMKEPWVDFNHPAFNELKQFLLTTFGPSLPASVPA